MAKKKFDSTTVIETVKKHSLTMQWVNDARAYSKELKALVLGEDFTSLLERIEHVEGEKKAIARKKYSKDIRDLFSRVLEKRENVFQANGGSLTINVEGDAQKELFIKTLNEFKGGKSIDKYMSEYFFRQLDIDPNGLIFLEYKVEDNEEIEVYPTYKSINDIRFYEADGQKCEYVVFEPKKVITPDKRLLIEWRIVDELTDWTIIQIGSTYYIDEERTFEHPFGDVPAIILSDLQRIGYRNRLSPLHSVIELAKDYARDKSVYTIYKYQNAFPKHWQYESRCRDCSGLGKTGKETCSSCSGTGILQRKDVTDSITVTKPKEGDPILTPNLAGYIQPDIETWVQMKVDLKDWIDMIEDTFWGTETTENVSETATGRFIDVQPITNKLNKFADSAEWAQNTLANWVASLVVKVIPEDTVVYHKSYGRRFIIESPDTILDRYETSKTAGDSTTILDKLLQEFILSKYKTDPIMQEKMLKKSIVEPYIHYSIDQINTIFGKEEAFKKAVFGDFWETADITKTVEQLSAEFIIFVNTEKTNRGIKNDSFQVNQ